MQSASFLPCVILSAVACQSVSYFSKLSQKPHDFRKRVIDNKMSVLIIFLYNVRRIQKNTSLCKVTLFLSNFNEILSTELRKILKYQILVGAVRMGRRT